MDLMESQLMREFRQAVQFCHNVLSCHAYRMIKGRVDSFITQLYLLANSQQAATGHEHDVGSVVKQSPAVKCNTIVTTAVTL